MKNFFNFIKLSLNLLGLYLGRWYDKCKSEYHYMFPERSKIKVRKELLELATEENGCGKYPTPADITDQRLNPYLAINVDDPRWKEKLNESDRNH